ncbi:unnamed protein product [Caenorhabditis angaria]|uniref:Uncharacterized protein n=1 Tax=Caenorhabditis angaria TaxID=860376 RepID=A0A9P1MVP4_9PELO|nr:unnamed protein product [Caenorhabditis angaria]
MIRSRSPEMSPDMKKAKLEVFPDHKKLTKPKLIDKEEVSRFVSALGSFEVPSEGEMVIRSPQKLRQHPNKDIEDYFIASAQWGVPAISWEIVRPVFLWKLNFVLKEFVVVEKQIAESKKDEESSNFDVSDKVPEAPREKLSIMGSRVNLIKTTPVVFNLEENIQFILDKAQGFEGFPFTWQRVCELLSDPMQHYNKIGKFVRAFDKVINIVTTITEWGGRVNGEWEIPVDSTVHHFESVFFGPVDEVEAMDKANKKQEEDEKPLDMRKKNNEEKDGEVKEEAVVDDIKKEENEGLVVADSSEEEKMEVDPETSEEPRVETEKTIKSEEQSENV